MKKTLYLFAGLGSVIVAFFLFMENPLIGFIFFALGMYFFNLRNQELFGSKSTYTDKEKRDFQKQFNSDSDRDTDPFYKHEITNIHHDEIMK